MFRLDEREELNKKLFKIKKPGFLEKPGFWMWGFLGETGFLDVGVSECFLEVGFILYLDKLNAHVIKQAEMNRRSGTIIFCFSSES